MLFIIFLVLSQEASLLDCFLICIVGDFDETTPEILRAFVNKVIIHEKVKVDGHYVHTIETIYNFVEAIDLPVFDAHLREEN